MRRVLTGAGVVLGLIAGLVAPATWPSAAAAAADDWPMFHHDAVHSGVSGETSISASSVAGLEPRWQANTGAASFTSPAVVYDATSGRSLVYEGNQNGTMAAYDALTGDRVWYFKVGAHIQSSAAVAGGYVYFGSNDYYLYALDASTGALECRFYTGGAIASSPVVGDPDGLGNVVYLGDNGLTGSDDGGHLWAVNGVDPSHPNKGCTAKWLAPFTGFGDPLGSQPLAGSWSPPAFVRDRGGRALVIFGGSSPDDAVYAVDATSGGAPTTGAPVWRFQTVRVTLDNDVGAGPTVTAPGVNGFADGVVYVGGKDNYIFALDLSTGAEIWEFNIAADTRGLMGAVRSTIAVVGDRLYVGYGSGVYELNAITGAKVWKTQDFGATTREVVSSPAVSGPPGDRVLFVGDLGGTIRAFDAQTGHQLWSYSTDGFIYSSASLSAGQMYIASSDGFVYAFGIGAGGASDPPDTTITSPANDAALPNPRGDLQVSGDATDDLGVQQVLVAIKDRNSAKWWQASTGTWSPVFMENPAVLQNPGGMSTGWSLAIPMPPSGGAYYTQAEAVDGDGQHDTDIPSSLFTVASTGSPPETAIVEPDFKQVYTFPGGVRQSFRITISGTANDVAGPNPSVGHVYLYIKNREHAEYYCGKPCKPGGAALWSPTFRRVQAVLASPGSTTTTWTYTFPTYDHPHSYYVAAWAVDMDKEIDKTRAHVARFCVRDPGDTTCF